MKVRVIVALAGVALLFAFAAGIALGRLIAMSEPPEVRARG